MLEILGHIIKDLCAVACLNGLIHTWETPNPFFHYFGISGFCLVFAGEALRLAVAVRKHNQ